MSCMPILQWLFYLQLVVMTCAAVTGDQLTERGDEMPCPLGAGILDLQKPMICQTRIANEAREEVVAFIRRQKALHRDFRVIDLGASGREWSEGLIDAYIDLLPMSGAAASAEAYLGDMNEMDVYLPILEVVRKRGKFDFAICSHTLEDLRNPVMPMKMMPLLAKAGFVATPSKHAELARFEFGPNGPRGWIHHRWIFLVQNGELLACPKLPVLDAMPELSSVALTSMDQFELTVWWRNGLPFRLLNGDFMGPNKDVVLDLLRGVLGAAPPVPSASTEL